MPAEFHPHVPELEQAGVQPAGTGVLQLAVVQDAVHVQTVAVPAVFQTHVPPFSHAGLQTGDRRLVQLVPDQAAVHLQTGTAGTPPEYAHVPPLEHVGLQIGVVERQGQNRCDVPSGTALQ